MRVSKTSNKPLVLSMALMVLMALVIPFAGTALANHETVTGITLTPEADSAATGTCNQFTATVQGNDAPGEGETFEIRATQQDADASQDLEIAFCDPDEQDADRVGGDIAFAGENLNEADCDDNNAPNDGGCLLTPAPATAEAAALIIADCTTSDDNPAAGEEAAGQCTFGVTSDEPGTMQVRACVTETTTDQFGETTTTTYCDNSTKTWTQGGVDAVETLDCEPEADQNPEGDEHTFLCTATNEQGDTVRGVTPEFDVTAGPNEEEVENQNCTATNNEGVATCTYRDANDGDVGTDTILVFLDQASDDTTANTANQADADEPQDQITKNWFGNARVINCEPETAENPAGTTHTVTCTVTDREGQAVPGETVTFTEDGAGRFNEGSTRTTDATGTVTVTTSTFGNEEGLQEITGSLGRTAGTDECERFANDPTDAPAGACEDQVVKNWVAGDGQPPQCNDGIDNDGDGDIDFPDDPGCTSLEDNTEAPNPGGGGPGPTRGPCAGFAFNSRTPKADGSGLVIVGSPENDILIGTDGDDTICALGGDDQVDALEGQDQVVGNGGADEIDGGRGKDQLKGGRGRDIISGRGGNDVIAGGAGNDTLKGNKGIDSIRGEDGNDTIQGGSHQDTLIGGQGADVLRGWTGDDVIKGGGGHDIINGHRGFDICRGGRGNNVIRNCER